MADAMRGVVRGAVAERWFGGGDAREVAPRTWFVPSMANVAALGTDDGLLIVDTSLRQLAPAAHKQIRGFTDAPLHTAVYSHGHIDHANGLRPWLEEAERRPRIVAHRNVLRRFRNYARLARMNEHINEVQFGIAGVRWPTEFDEPDTVYDDALTLTIGGERFELRHGKGETDDATWVWAADRGIVCTGDFWISCVPNCGNPQKVQRYPEEWIETLDRMAALEPELLLPGHGPVIAGRDDVRRALTDASAYLGSIVEQTIAALNEGLTHDEIVARVRPPESLADRPYLQPVYDRPEFIVRNLIRLHGGWWDGHPANLMPAAADDRAREIVALAGGVERVVARARELAEDDIALACHLAEWAAAAAPDDRSAQECVRDLFARRADDEVSLMGRGIYLHAVRRAEAALGER